MKESNKPGYKISNRNVFGEYYVLKIRNQEIVFGGSHENCVYIATRLNESDDDLETIMNELRSGKPRLTKVDPKEVVT